MGLTQTYENGILNALTRNAASFAQPSALYAALFSAAPTATTPGVEFTTGVAYNYARQPVTFGAASGGSAVSSVDVGWPPGSLGTVLTGAPSPWPPAVALGVFDALTGGNLWYFDLLAAKPVLTNGFQLLFAAGSIVLSLS